jgi:hypothetical protein
VESLLTAAPADKGDGDGDGEYRVASGAVQTQGEGSLSRGYLGVYSVYVRYTRRRVCTCLSLFDLSTFLRVSLFLSSHPYFQPSLCFLLSLSPPIPASMHQFTFSSLALTIPLVLPLLISPSFIFLTIRFFHES